MRSLLLGARRALRRPSGAPGAAARGSGERLSKAGLGLLSEAGLSGREAARAWRALFGYAIGFPDLDGDGRADFDYGLERLLDGIESRV